jgi:hypothetical protein
MRHFLLIGLIGLAGCAQAPGRYPSLLPRPAESRSNAEPVAAAPVAAAPDPTLDARIAGLSQKVDAAYQAFSKAAQAAEAKVAVARGTAQGSEPWLNAQVALAELDAARQPLGTAEADLESLAIERGTAGQPDYPALESALATARAQVDKANQRSDSLEAALK